MISVDRDDGFSTPAMFLLVDDVPSVDTDDAEMME